MGITCHFLGSKTKCAIMALPEPNPPVRVSQIELPRNGNNCDASNVWILLLAVSQYFTDSKAGSCHSIWQKNTLVFLQIYGH